MARLLSAVARLLAVLALPLLFTGTAVRFLFTWPPLYEYALTRYQIADRTGIAPDDLQRASQALIAYFSNDDPTVNLMVTQRGVVRPLFSEREVLHLVDVKALVRLFVRLQELALVALVLLAGLALWRARGAALPAIGAVLGWGSALTLALLAGLVVLALVDFDQLFLQFHLLSFRENDFWLLDPRQHNLIALFPPPFWFDATLLLALVIGLQALIVAVVGWQVRRLAVVSPPRPAAPAERPLA